jgi:uncharacterized protein (TIGR00251 family)
MVERSPGNNDDAFQIRVKVIPRANKDQISGFMQDGTLKIRIAAPPVDGKANQALVKFLSGSLDLDRDQISITSGTSSRNKILEIRGISMSEFRAKIKKLKR